MPRSWIWIIGSFFLFPSLTSAQGIMIPRDRSIGPMTLVDHRVKVELNDQVAVTNVKQKFRNHAHRALEATYVFTVPKGAMVKDFAMMVNGKRIKGELLEAPKAKAIYTDIVRRTQDPGLLEYIGTDLLQMSVFPVPAHGDQEVEVTFTSLAGKQEGTVEYLYPMRTQSGVLRVQGEFAFEMELKASYPIQNIYSPTHPISFSRKNDRHATVFFDKSFSVMDRDLQLFYTTGKEDIGLTLLQHRPALGDGYFLMLLAPRADIAANQRVPRDMVFVIDTSGSMREDGKIDQAKKALKYGLDSLKPGDRYAMFNFATTVNSWQSQLVAASQENIAAGKKWVEALETTGGTAINDALQTALELQHGDKSRSFTIVFFTDGKPTIGVTDTNQILTNFDRKAKENIRLFSFGVGYDLDAAFIDRLAEKHKGTSSYVRPNEDMEVKVSSFFNQIHQPVLTDLKLATGSGPRLVEIYPPQLPDLFHGGQLVVLGRYQGTGKGVIRLTGQVGTATKEFNYEVDLQEKPDAKPYVEDLWARRKVGYMIDQIRTSGEKKELVDEVILLAKKYGIATPYTSYLVVPDEIPWRGVPGRPIPLSRPPGYDPRFDGRPNSAGGGAGTGKGVGGGGLGGGGFEGKPGEVMRRAADQGAATVREQEHKVKINDSGSRGNQDSAQFRMENLSQARRALGQGQLKEAQTGQTGVELSMDLNQLKNQSQVGRNAQRMVQARNCIEINGVWIDDQLKKETPKFEIKAMSNAYFKLLERKPEMKEVLQLGNAVVWIAPNGTALIIDPASGKEEVTDEEIDRLFVVKK